MLQWKLFSEPVNSSVFKYITVKRAPAKYEIASIDLENLKVGSCFSLSKQNPYFLALTDISSFPWSSISANDLLT